VMLVIVGLDEAGGDVAESSVYTIADGEAV
jgi:hypothetical protein